jgi:hypothetical protein
MLTSEQQWRIEDEESVEARDGALWSPLRFRVYRGQEPIFVARVTILTSLVHDVMSSLGVARETEGYEPAVDHALARFGLRRVEDALRRGLAPEETTRDIWQVQVEQADLPLFRELLMVKSCRWQVLDDGELLCSAAARDDKSAIGSLGRRRVAPTTRSACGGCQVPDADLICSHLIHPEVIATPRGAVSGRIGRFAQGAACDLGRSGAGQDLSRCRSGGHDCFERLVEEEDVVPVALASPLALPEAFDYLDSVWRLAFGKQYRLVRMPTAADVAGLSQDAETRSDLETRLSELMDVIGMLEVHDDLIPASANDDERVASMNRLAVLLKNVLAPDAWLRAEDAIKTLRAVNAARVAAQHGARADLLPKAFQALRIPYPAPSPSVAWDQIRARTVEALGIVREEVRQLTV